MRRSSQTPQEVGVRAARTSDAARIAVLSGQLGYPCSSAGIRSRLARNPGRCYRTSMQSP